MVTRDEKRWAEVRRPVYLDEGEVVLLDQRQLPAREVWNRYTTAAQVAGAIRAMEIRGAPAIGCAAAMGLAAEARGLPDPELDRGLRAACDLLVAARPTAVNLAWAVDRQRRVLQQNPADLRQALAREAEAIQREDLEACRAMGRLGAALIPDGATVLTHCNTGALATGGHGTALGVIRSAVEAKNPVRVLADETRPYLQGARLTAWELQQEGIDVTVICDSAAGALMHTVDCVIVGADRIAQNGDVANKVGTYSLAVLARHHDVPFFVAAPLSTIDLDTPTGEAIPIEERPADEVTHLAGKRLAPEGVPARNIAFDVTPHDLVSALITEAGIARPPDEASIRALFG